MLKAFEYWDSTKIVLLHYDLIETQTESPFLGTFEEKNHLSWPELKTKEKTLTQHQIAHKA